MERFNYWAAFAGTGKVEDYLQYVSHKKDEESKRGHTGEYTNGAENKGDNYQGTGSEGE